ncbi:MAG: tRNA (adenosine(37)-N6)-threonylcarbamoyltransferase complex ATPase subunit type 1 TsaE [Gemmatimonadaceae bacterium]|nr:tRNA (adenosine(37)-N6)-threonylcarbamoyltransferase complex ATPase subunit type 1 TsaE [Gemmatimonadaceae bacterium]
MDAHHHIVPDQAPCGHLAVTRDELIAWGERFGRSARARLVVAIAGDLGAGKTTLVQAICRGAGVTAEVTSPTYALVHEYKGDRFPIYHLDLYRLEKADDLTNLGWDDILRANALVLVEWPERGGDRIPADAVPIDLELDPADEERRLLLAG